MKKPNLKDVKAVACRELEQEYLTPGEGVLGELFQAFPRNGCLDEIYLKVVVINRIFSTQIWKDSIPAKHIHCHREKIDDKLKKGDYEVIDVIAKMNFNGNIKRNYSFATKYCHCHQPDKFRIYDSFVDKALWKLNKKHPFANFKRRDLKDYKKFMCIYDQFVRHFKLESLTNKQLDKYLHSTGRCLNNH